MRDQGSFVLSLVLLVAASGAPAQVASDVGRIGVSPARVELTIGPRPVTESLRVLNYGSQPVEVKVSVNNWDLDDDSRVRLLPPTEQSLDQWMVVNPLRFTIDAGASQTVRFSVRPRVKPEPGEHRAMIYFEQVPAGAGPSEANTFRTVFRLGVAVYGQVGEAVREARLHAVDVDSGAVWFDVSSDGTAHARLGGQYAIWPAQSYPGSDGTTAAERTETNDLAAPAEVVRAGYLPTTPILPGTRRRLRLALPADLEPGAYVLDLNASLAGEPLDRGVPFSVAGPGRDAGEARPPDAPPR